MTILITPDPAHVHLHITPQFHQDGTMTLMRLWCGNREDGYRDERAALFATLGLRRNTDGLWYAPRAAYADGLRGLLTALSDAPTPFGMQPNVDVEGRLLFWGLLLIGTTYFTWAERAQYDWHFWDGAANRLVTHVVTAAFPGSPAPETDREREQRTGTPLGFAVMRFRDQLRAREMAVPEPPKPIRLRIGGGYDVLD